MGKGLSKEAQQFVDLYGKKAEVTGFWTEEYKSIMIKYIESTYKHEIIRDLFISDIVINGDKMLIKWQSRFQPLSDEQMEKEYGIKTKK